MKLGHNQLRILRFIAEQGHEVTYAEIVGQFKTQYYTNAATTSVCRWQAW